MSIEEKGDENVIENVYLFVAYSIQYSTTGRVVRMNSFSRLFFVCGDGSFSSFPSSSVRALLLSSPFGAQPPILEVERQTEGQTIRGF